MEFKQDIAEQYVSWLLTPPGYREPATKKEFAAAHGVNVRSLYNWEKSEWFRNKIKTEKGDLSVTWLGDILGRLKEIVDSGPPKDAVAASRVLLGYLEVPETERTGPDEDTVRKILEAAGIKIAE